jgi:hypothetical protein
MSVENIECQIAKAQIGRYITGDALSPEAVEQLEAHIADCRDCKEQLALRRQSLMSMLGASTAGDLPAQAVVQVPTARTSVADALRAAAADKVERLRVKPQTPAAPSDQSAPAKSGGPAQKAAPSAVQRLATGSAPSWKPIAYSVALAAALIAMSLVAQNPTSLLGARAAEALPAATPPVLDTPPASAPGSPTGFPTGFPTGSVSAAVVPPALAESGAGNATEPTAPSPDVQNPVVQNPVSDTPVARSAPPEVTPVEPPTVEVQVRPAPTAPSPQAQRPQAQRPQAQRPQAQRPQAQRSQPRPNQTRPSPTSNGGGTIRIYDADGNPIR